MPQAIESITVHLSEPPVGIFRDALAHRDIDIVGQVMTRLEQIGALIFVMKTSEEFQPVVQSALGALEALVDDTKGLLTVVPAGCAA